MRIRTAFFSPLILLALSTLLLTACGPQTPDSDIDSSINTPRSKAEQIQWLLADAQRSESPKQEGLQIQAIRLLLDEQQRELAWQVIEQMNPEFLNRPQFFDYSELLCRLLISQGEYSEALATLESPRLLDEGSQLDVEQQLVFNDLRAQALGRLGKHLASAQQRIYSDPLLTPEQQLANRESLWRSLMLVSSDDINHYLPNAFSTDYQGWLELALIAKNSQANIDEQVAQLDKWMLRWPMHSAAGKLPDDLELIRELAANQPEHVALMLPLSGKLAKYGKSIRDGYMAAYYQARQRGADVPKLTIYDTEQHSQFIPLYHQAVNQGAELIIGPLDKRRLSLLYDEIITVPTLALNRIENYGSAPEQLFQFGLAPQDEALQIADIAFLENHQHAMIIAPQSEWGQKMTGTFSQRWNQLGSAIIAESFYTNQKDFSSSIKNTLLLQHSELRARRIQGLIGERLEFLPRRRQDVDMIFLLARPQQARSIKPLLDYHYAGELPIYATSRVYAGIDDPRKDRDIEGVKFTDMPWLLQPSTELKQLINREIKGSKQLQHMYALGVDSFQLSPRLRQLKEIPNSRVYGQTGTLKLAPNNQIERSMLLATIKSGKAQLTAIAELRVSDDSKTGETKDGQHISQTLGNQKHTDSRATN